jgi:hypothetical protein
MYALDRIGHQQLSPKQPVICGLFACFQRSTTLDQPCRAVASEKCEKATLIWNGSRSTLKQYENGLFLTRDELSFSYAIILHNVRTYRSAGVVAIVRGKQNAELALKEFVDSQNSSDHHEGWRYFLEKSDLQAGTDPAEATDRRQADLELRESKVPEEPKTTIRPPSKSHR